MTRAALMASTMLSSDFTRFQRLLDMRLLMSRTEDLLQRAGIA